MLGILALLLRPSKFTTLTASDLTDISDLANKGLYVTTAGTVYVQGAGDASIILLATFAAGSFIPGRFKRFGATSSATCVGAST